MAGISRREILGAGALVGASAILQPTMAVLPKANRFRFVHFTDIHIQPELGAPDGVAMAVRKVLSLNPRPDFVLIGGDHFMDVLECTSDRKDTQLKLVQEALKPLEMPIHSCVGNHDVYGWSHKSSVLASDPLYGKKLLEEKVMHGPTYSSFDHKGWHFVTLDSIQLSGKDWSSGVDEAQLAWLKTDLEKAAKTPTVVLTHMPIVTAFTQYWISSMGGSPASLIMSNGKAVLDTFKGKSVKTVLQGHTHIVELCEYNGTQYITGGAVCGEWWHGPREGIHPEGFMVYDVDGDSIRHEYVASGWKAQGK